MTDKEMLNLIYERVSNHDDIENGDYSSLEDKVENIRDALKTHLGLFVEDNYNPSKNYALKVLHEMMDFYKCTPNRSVEWGIIFNYITQSREHDNE